jgi:protein kinase-like protein
MSLASGARLGPYEIVSPLGRGGMGEVYRATDTRLGRDVAVKVIRSDSEVNATQLARFEDETRAIAALNHPNILALHDIGNSNGVVYAVMELLDGETLRTRLARGKLPVVKTIDYAIQIARGLAAAHERGFIHRDLKPDNLFLTQDGRVKILDFGLAQQEPSVSTDADTQATRFTTGPGIVVGTPGYIAPEQMFGAAATTRSDLFAFGVVVHEMLTGSHPFSRGTVTDTATAIVRDDPPPLSPAVAGLPTGVAKIIERCLEKHAADRPGSARDLALYLEAIGTAPDQAATVQSVEPGEIRRLRLRVLAVACGLAASLAVAPWIIVRAMSSRAVTAAIDADLTRAEQVARRVQRDRFNAVALTARLIASFPELKALFATDAATVRDYLASYQQRNSGAPLLVALGADSKIIARTDNVAPGAGDDEWIGALLGGHGDPIVVPIGGRPYHAAAAPVEAGGNLFGYIIGAAPVDAEFAGALREATQDEVLLFSNAALLASTLRSPAPWRTGEEWRSAGGGPDRSTSVTIGVQQFIAREVPLVDKPSVSAVLLASRDEADAPFGRIQTGLAILALLGLAAAAIGGVLIARAVGRTFNDKLGLMN